MNNKIKNICTLIFGAFLLTSCYTLNSSSAFFNGIDVSHYQGDIDWGKVAENKNIKFAYIKASEGATVRDKTRAIYAYGAKSNKIKVGYYHFFRASSTGADQFQNYLEAIEGLPIDLIPVLDIETEPKASEMANFENGIKVFMHLCKIRFGVYPIIYTMPNFDKKYLGFLADRKKWYCGRVGNENAIMEKCVMWQLAIQPINGIKGNVDLDLCPKMRKIRKYLR